jgi:hypothetical protein
MPLVEATQELAPIASVVNVQQQVSIDRVDVDDVQSMSRLPTASSKNSPFVSAPMSILAAVPVRARTSFTRAPIAANRRASTSAFMVLPS